MQPAPRLLMIVSLVMAEPAVAQPAASVRLARGDLAVDTPQGARATLARIEQAAWAACRAQARSRSRDFDGLVRVDTCRRGAVARAVQALDAPYLTAAWRGANPVIRLARSPR